MVAKTTCRDDILRITRAYVKRTNRNQFTLEEISEEVCRLSDQTLSTVRTHIASRLCENGKRGHQTVYSDFRRVGRGLYELINFD